MRRPKNYNTKQREAILSYLIQLSGEHVTAAQIASYFHEVETAIGRTTIYRHLDKMTESGDLRRYTTDGISGACYQFVDHPQNCPNHLHLKCETCGELKHLDCDMLHDIHHHVLNEHDFQINSLKTVLYGHCRDCELA